MKPQKELARDWLDGLLQVARAMIALGQEHTPMICPIKRSDGPVGYTLGTMTIFELHDPDIIDRELYMEKLARMLLADDSVIAYFMVTEAWVIDIPKGEKLTQKPRYHPGRVEVLSMEVQFRDGYHLNRLYRIVRPSEDEKRGSTLELKNETSTDNGDTSEGVMVDLFKYLKPASERFPNPTYEELNREPS